MEHVASSQMGLPLCIQLPVTAEEITVSANDFLGLRIPYDKLFIAVITNIKLINIHALTRTTASRAESDLTEPAYLLHDIRRVIGSDDIDLIMTFVGHTQLFLGRQLTLEDVSADRLDNLFFHNL